MKSGGEEVYIVDTPTVATWAFIKAKPYGIDTLSLNDLNEFGWAIQQRCNELGLDVLVNRQPQDFRDMTVQWYDGHQQYFTLIMKDDRHYIRRLANLLILKDRFTPYQPVAKAIRATPFIPHDIPRELGCNGCAHNQDSSPHPHDIACQGCCRNAPDRYTPKEVGQC